MGLFSGIARRYRSFKRYNQIIRVFVKYGFKDLVSQLIESGSFKWIRRLIPRTTRKKAKLETKWVKMRLICEELGPTFVKFGQILSNRPDLLPAGLVHEFEKLQDNVPPFSGEVARQVVETDLKKSTKIIFQEFSAEPFASASIAQVHKAKLMNGDVVAIKIQRPNIKEMIVEDIKVMYTLASIFEKRIPSLKAFDPQGLVKHFEESILKELDFIHESINLQRFYANLEEDKAEKRIISPRVYRDFTSSKVLTMEFMKGVKISNFVELEKAGHDRKKCAHTLADSYLKQVFQYGFFHADLHPGNILVIPDGRLCFLDFGLMGSIMPKDIEMIGRLFLAVKEKDVKKIIQSFQQMSGQYTVQNMREFEYAISEFVNSYSVHGIHENEMSNVLMELKEIVVEHGLKVPSHFFLLARSMVTVEGVIHKLDPEFDMLELATPYMRRLFAKNLNPIVWGKKFLDSLYNFGSTMEGFPRDLKNAIRRINTGQITVNLNHQGIDPMVHTVNRVTKQIVTALIVTGLLIGSVMLITNEIGPKWHDYSIIGIIGLSLATILVLGMLRDIWKGDHDDWKGWNRN